MNRRQELFVAEYLVSRNATEAAKKAGYAESRARQTGSDLLHKPHVAAAIEKADRERRERLGVDGDWIVDRLVFVHEEAAKDRSWHAAVRPLEALMKHLGIGGAEKHEVSVSGEVVYTLTLDRTLPTLDDQDEELSDNSDA